MLKIVRYAEEPHFKNTFANFDRKLHKNVIKRCAIEPLEIIAKKLDIIASNLETTKYLIDVVHELCDPKYCTEALSERLAQILN